MLNFLMIFVLTVFIPVFACSVEIPLEKQTNVSSQGNTDKTSLGYVDIDKVFSEHPMTRRLKDEFCVTADKKKKEVANMELEIGRFEQMIISTTTALNKAKSDLVILKSLATNKQVVISTATHIAISTTVPKEFTPAMNAEKEKAIADMQKDIDGFKKTVETKKQELVKLVNSEKDCLTKLEEDETNAVLADIYTVFETVAEEEGVTIIVDKSQVLYGKTVKDLTDKVLDRLRGR